MASLIDALVARHGALTFQRSRKRMGHLLGRARASLHRLRGLLLRLPSFPSRYGVAAATTELNRLQPSTSAVVRRWLRVCTTALATLMIQAYEASEQLTPTHVMKETGLSRRQVFEELRRGRLPCHYVHGQPRITRRDLNAWLARRQDLRSEHGDDDGLPYYLAQR